MNHRRLELSYESHRCGEAARGDDSRLPPLTDRKAGRSTRRSDDAEAPDQEPASDREGGAILEIRTASGLSVRKIRLVSAVTACNCAIAEITLQNLRKTESSL